ncbi:MAG: hypothetical protein HYZ28_25420 [Myxococcales bacterium]|nr:hypothetical protein [Myxococcales bacterium]
MVALLLSALLAGAPKASKPPSPRAHPDAEVAVFIPRLDRLEGLSAWFRLAGARAALFRPESWRGEMHPLLSLDPTRAQSLAEAGIEPAGAATVSYAGYVRMSCTSLRDAKRFEQRAGERLSTLGQPWNASAEGGVSLVGAKSLERVIAGYALKGSEACAVSAQGSSVEPALKFATELVRKGSSGPRWKAALSLPGTAVVVTPDGAAGLSTEDRTLTVEGRAAHLALPPLQGAGSSPYASMPPSGMAFVRARVSPAGFGQLARMLQGQLTSLCDGCERGELAALGEAVSGALTGNVLLRVDSVRVRGSLKTAPARYFALRHAYLAELSSPDQVRELLGRLSEWKSARAEGDGYALAVRGGEVLIGVRGDHLYVGNDPGAVRAALEAAPEKASALPHGADFAIDPALVARGLAQVSLLDVMTSQELAGVFAAGAELGPLLAASERISGWLDPAGAEHRFRAVWTLKAAPPPPVESPDGGR